MKKYQVNLTALTPLSVTVEVETDDPYEDIDPYYAIDEALYDYKKYPLEQELLKQLMSNASGTVNFTVESWEEITEGKQQ